VIKEVTDGWRQLWVLALLALPVAGLAQTTVDPDLVESIRWYVGATGRVDDARAKALLEKAAADADPLSTMWMARVYSTGRMGFKADARRAKEIAAGVIGDVEALAGQGNIEAQFLMGTAFAEKLGKPRDDVAAVGWYRRAAEAGHLLAQHNLGNAYDSGTGVRRDPVQAVAWWRRAAEQGDAIPQFQLGRSYERGVGVTWDLREAYAWYSNSASRGYGRAIDAVRRMDRSRRR
jgi:uncharacterized protein